MIRGGQLFIGQDNIVFWGDPDDPDSGLYDNKLKRYVNDADVSFVLKDASGDPVDGGAGTMTYVAGSRGRYEGVLEEDVLDATDLNLDFFLEITATASGDRVGFRRIKYKAVFQGAG